MADWTDIDVNTLLPGEPVTSAIMLALEENPRAIADGATGAPRILPEAMSGSVAGETLLFGTGGTGQTFTSLPDSVMVVGPSQFRAITSCTVRVRGQYRRLGDNASVSFSIKKNGSDVLSESTTSTIFQTSASVDVSLVAGDLVLVVGEGGSGGTPENPLTSSIQIRDIKYTVGGQRTVGGI